jgi:hypothetical protein
MEDQGVKEAYCDTCERFTPLMEEPLTQDDLNPFPWGDLFCGECYAVHMSVRLNTGNMYEEPTVRRQRLCVQIYRDGAQWYAQVGPNLEDGVVGFGRTVEEAIQALGVNAIQRNQSLLEFVR